MHIPLATYRELLKDYLWPQRGAVALMSNGLCASVVLQLVGPQVIRSFIDATQRGDSQAVLIQAAMLFIVVALLQQIIHLLTVYWSERVSWTATNALRADIASHLIRLDVSFHKTRTSGELIERVDGDVNALAEFLSSLVVQFIGNILLLIGILVAFYLVDLRLGLAFTIFGVVTLIALLWVRQFGTHFWKEERERSANFYGYISELISATEDVRSNGAVPYALQRFFIERRRWLPIALRADLWGGLIWLTAIALFAVGDAIAYGIGGRLYLLDAITLGQVYLVISYTAMLAAPIETIRTQLQNLQKADASILRVQELLKIQSNLADGNDMLPTGPLEVEMRHVYFQYEDDHRSPNDGDGQTYALENLSFTVQPGQVLGILGRTGSGKTTITRLLFRMYDSQQGTIRLSGVNIRTANLQALRARIGLVTQDVQLLEATLRDNITFFNPSISDKQLLQVFATLELQTWFERLPQGLDTLISNATLSAGEAQLIALARVFIKNPGLVILDEASSRLDPATEALLERALDKLLENRTAVIIAHRLGTLDRTDDILIVEQGTTVEYAPRHQLVADPNSRFAQLRRTGLGDILT